MRPLRLFTRVAAVLGVAVSVSEPLPVGAQTFEVVGTRALGMGGAFVAVADDATATWWNPAGLATGATVDLALAGGRPDGRAEPAGGLPVARTGGTVLAFATPAFGASYYRFRVTDIQVRDSTGPGAANRQEEGAIALLHTVAVSQAGLTLVQFVGPGLHVGTTVKYLRAGGAVAEGDFRRRAGDLLDEGAGLGVSTAGAFDLDVGVMAAVGALRVGVTARNLRQPELAVSRAADGILTERFERQVRAGVAIDVAAAGGPPLIVAVDGDLRPVSTPFGDRRNVAVGAERWFGSRRLGVRGGVRASTVGERRATAAAGASVAARTGLYVEGQATRGGDRADRGWTIGARMTF